YNPLLGAIAQLAERRTRIAEVESSSLFRSTKPRSTRPSLVAVVLVAVLDSGRAARTGEGGRISRIAGVGDRLLDVLKGQEQLVAGHGDGGHRDHGHENEDQRKFDHRLALPFAVSSG